MADETRLRRRARLVIVAFVVAFGAGAAAFSMREVHREERVADDGADPQGGRQGELHVRVLDAEGALPLLSRVVVRPIGTGGGRTRVADLRHGELKTTVKSGRYRVSAGRGVEWSMDAKTIEVVAGGSVQVELRLRHVVESETLVACDLDLHANPGPTSTMTEDERVLSVAATGIQLAVAMDHDVVGDYAPALSRTALTGKVTMLAGVEITTSSPAIGHFGVFPFAKGSDLPRSDRTRAAGIFATARRGDTARIIVVHHPRAPRGEGYFEAAGFDAAGPPPAEMSTDFDAIEVYGGADLTEPARAEAVLRDWFSVLESGKRIVASGGSNSHGNELPWAGLPRTYVDIGRWKQGYSGGPLDVEATLDALRDGHGFVTSGPTIDLTISGNVIEDAEINKGLGTVLSAGKPGEAKPGSTLAGTTGLVAHLRVRAPSWVDVSTVSIIAGGSPVYEVRLPSRPVTVGEELGDRADVIRRATRFDENIALAIPSSARWIVAVVRGERADEDAVPGVAHRPLAFTNPIWIEPLRTPER